MVLIISSATGGSRNFVVVVGTREKMSRKEEIENVNPQRFGRKGEREITPQELNDEVEDPIDEREIFGNCFFYPHACHICHVHAQLIFISDLLRDINDPEHPMSLEELNVVRIDNILVR